MDTISKIGIFAPNWATIYLLLIVQLPWIFDNVGERNDWLIQSHYLHS